MAVQAGDGDDAEDWVSESVSRAPAEVVLGLNDSAPRGVELSEAKEVTVDIEVAVDCSDLLVCQRIAPQPCEDLRESIQEEKCGMSDVIVVTRRHKDDPRADSQPVFIGQMDSYEAEQIIRGPPWWHTSYSKYRVPHDVEFAYLMKETMAGARTIGNSSTCAV